LFPGATWNAWESGLFTTHSVAETDLVILTGRNLSPGRLSQLLSNGIHVLSIGDEQLVSDWTPGSIGGPDEYLGWHLVLGGSRELHRPSTPAAHYFERGLEQLVDSYPNHRPCHFEISQPTVALMAEPPEAIEPLLTTPDGSVIAALFSPRMPSGDPAKSGTVLLLPGAAADMAVWSICWLAWLHTFHAETVPVPPPTSANPTEWMTEQELGLKRELELAEALAEDARSRVLALRAESNKLRTDIDRGQRALLTAGSEDLERAVTAMLEEFGFQANMLDQEGGRGPRGADILVRDPEDAEWEALVEVKSYRSGVKANHADQLRKHVELFEAEIGKSPGSVWWIVNHSLLQDASERVPPSADIADAARRVGATLIWTCDLYRIWQHSKQPMTETRCSEIRSQLRHLAPGYGTVRDFV